MARLGIDVMGGDFAPASTIKGAILAKEKLSDADRIVLVGNPERIHAALNEFGGDPSDFDVLEATEDIAMNEHPTKAILQKPNSGIAVGMHGLSRGSIDSFSSAGNTGAMLVGAFTIVKVIPGVIRPCITSIIPKENGGMGLILDVGTNADCKPEVLHQFGILGSHFAKLVYNIPNPKVGLINIGEEPEKGNQLTLAAHQLMAETSDFNFIGNVETRHLFDDTADVLVCDGFTGNVILKEAEAFFALLMKRGIRDEYFARFNYELYGGTPILGVNAPVLIGHGISSPKAICNMILLSKDLVQSQLHKTFNEVFS